MFSIRSIVNKIIKKQQPSRSFHLTDHNTAVNSKDFHEVSRRLRDFFSKKGFIETHTQNRLSILAACEDPFTISHYDYAGMVWPLPQTGQMWLEHELLSNPQEEGFFCVSTSYRNEPNPVPGRHQLIFPMFEFELKGGLPNLIKLETELLHHLGFKTNNSTGAYPQERYRDVANRYKVKELEHEHELRLKDDFGSVFFLTHFPQYTSPFWNMAREKGQYRVDDYLSEFECDCDWECKCKDEYNATFSVPDSLKVDVILDGVETIGSAERSSDKDFMAKQFKTISDGMYANKLYSDFTKKRVRDELDEFLSFDFFSRSGGGIGMTRLINAMKTEKLI